MSFMLENMKILPFGFNFVKVFVEIFDLLEEFFNGQMVDVEGLSALS